MNEDLIINPQNAIKFPTEDHIANVFIKDQIQAQKDYLILSEELWQEYKRRYTGFEIKRPRITLSDGHKRVEARLKQVIYLIALLQTY